MSPQAADLSVPATVNFPSLNSMSPSAASSTKAAPFLALASILSSALTIADMPTGPEREPYVPMPNCTLSVSPWTIEMLSIGSPSRSDTSCANVVSCPCPCECDPGRISIDPVGLTRTSAESPKPPPPPARPAPCARRYAAGFDIGGNADAAQFAAARRLALALADTRIVGQFHRPLQRGIEVAGVIGHDHRRLMRERTHEILAAQLRRIAAELAGADLDQALDHEACFRTPGPPIGVDRDRVRVDRVDLAID